MLKSLFLCALLLPLTLRASELEDSIDFFGWLEKHAKDFARCEPVAKGDHYVLCDQTKVPKAELKRLFALPAPELLAALKEKGLKVEMVCGAGGEGPVLEKACVAESSNKMFAEISSLHGKYLPDEKTILIRNSASPGSLLHEYVHSLQSENENEVYGQVYKRRRNDLQRALSRLMDRKIAAIQKLEQAGNKEGAKVHTQEFLIASEAMRGFAPWQDLIDERGIFLLYLKYGKEFGATEADLSLARKNMGFICRNPKLTKLIPAAQCKL